MIERRLSSETLTHLESLIGIDMRALAADSMHVYEHARYLGCHEIGFRSSPETLISFKTIWETHNYTDIHLFDWVDEALSSIPRDRSKHSVGPCSCIEFNNPRRLASIEILQLEAEAVIYDWALRLKFSDESCISLSTEPGPILGEIEVRLSGDLGELQENFIATHYKTIN